MPDMFGALPGIHSVGARPRVNSKRGSLVASSDELQACFRIPRKAAAAVNRAAVFCFRVVPAPPGKNPPRLGVHSLLFSGPGMSFLGQPVKITTRWMH